MDRMHGHIMVMQIYMHVDLHSTINFSVLGSFLIFGIFFIDVPPFCWQ